MKTSALIVLMSLGLTACLPPPQDAGIEVVRGVRAYEFRLEDGTRCVTVYNAGLVCEWRGR